MKQIYIPHTEWEDRVNGMWRKLPKDKEDDMLIKAIEFTGDHVKYGSAMREVSARWIKTMLNSLTNESINRRAFLGHCACQYKIDCPEYIVRMAWKKLTDNQRYLADKVAQQVINNWVKNYTRDEEKNRPVRKDMGRQMLFPWYSG